MTLSNGLSEACGFPFGLLLSWAVDKVELIGSSLFLSPVNTRYVRNEYDVLKIRLLLFTNENCFQIMIESRIEWLES